MKHRLAFRVVTLVTAVCTYTAGATTTKEQIRAEIERTSIQFFLDHTHPVTGLTRDTVDNFNDTPEWNRVASIASTGFSMAVLANAAMRGLISEDVAQDHILRGLRFSRDHVARYKGWFLHFMDWETGARMWGSEFSTIDTALFLAGALYAAEVFKNNTEINQIARQLYAETDFLDVMTDGGAHPDKRTISMAYSAEDGYTPSQWSMYAEQKLLLMLGLGHPTKPLPGEAWLAFSRKLTTLPNKAEVMGIEGALFTHQYSQMFIDFRGFSDGSRNYFENSRLMTELHRDIALTDKRFKSLQEGFWGFSAGDAPQGYRVWDAINYQGIVCIGCTVASAVFSPDKYLTDFAKWFDSPYAAQAWGRYGFVDSLDLDQNWFSKNVIGITVGPGYMSMANLDEKTSVWKDFMNIPEIKVALERAAAAGQGMAMQQGTAIPLAR